MNESTRVRSRTGRKPQLDTRGRAGPRWRRGGAPGGGAGGNGTGRGLVGYSGPGGGAEGGAGSDAGDGRGRVQERGGLGRGRWLAQVRSALATRRCAAKMAASAWARTAVVLLCVSDLLLLVLLPPRAFAAEGPAKTPSEATPPPRKKKKDIRDYNDADMARLLEQWEVRGARTPSLLFSVPALLCPGPAPSDLLPPPYWDPLDLRLGTF